MNWVGPCNNFILLYSVILAGIHLDTVLTMYVLCSIVLEQTLSGEKRQEHKVFLPCFLATCCSDNYQSFLPLLNNRFLAWLIPCMVRVTVLQPRFGSCSLMKLSRFESATSSKVQVSGGKRLSAQVTVHNFVEYITSLRVLSFASSCLGPGVLQNLKIICENWAHAVGRGNKYEIWFEEKSCWKMLKMEVTNWA